MRGIILLLLVITTGCTSAPPSKPGDICHMFREKKGWYEDASDSKEEWGSPIPVMMAIMHQESRFHAKAKPPRKKIFGFIPGPRPSDAYGYSQALESTWRDYKRSAGRYGADRDDFGDAIDFIGWYNHQSFRRSGIAKNDTYNLYLAYHEGQGGFNRGSYKSKQWLIDVARKVQRRSVTYTHQLAACEESLQDDGWFFGWF